MPISASSTVEAWSALFTLAYCIAVSGCSVVDEKPYSTPPAMLCAFLWKKLSGKRKPAMPR